MTDLSIQLYSGRNFPPLADQLRIVAAAGYRDVEPFRGLYDDVGALKAALDEHGLTARAGHYSMDLLEKEYDRAVEIARTLGSEIVVLPYVMPDDRPKDAEGWKGFGRRVGSIAKRLKGDGLRCAWHNHDFEMREIDGGSRPIQHILDTDMEIEWEADVAWIVRGGEDPATWLERYSGRVASLHVKDIAPAGEKTDEDGWADVGDGTLDWAKLFQAGERAGATLMIAEHDNPSDFERFATRSLKAMQSYAGAK
ncbi:sugar phosphate isomerase/epimerase family protein [Aureimonas leprariae]|uniref:Sugar phosphate isomerase/epimerase n=1 Tax=Plantimonas leprariae TaxID=2615207 RepID=A0A7V7PMV2_9HYPH|nr:sugar phosphate isomerase/epimerase [Aureimonas leprariae]KAB0678812.1 sugar phosphate isomerase/epimerase [Aureimonas leprariae]